MGVKTIRRIAADIAGVGENRIKFDPLQISKIDEALTREDTKGLIESGVIRIEKKLGVGKGRARKRSAQKKKGRRRSFGSRRGSKSARTPAKENWMLRIRTLRATLFRLKSEGKLESAAMRKLYLMAKGRAFKSIATMLTYIKDNKLEAVSDEAAKTESKADVKKE